MGYFKKRRFFSLYKGLDLAWWCPSRWLLTQHWFRAWVRGPSPYPSSQVIRYRQFFRRLSHASSFSESVPSVSQSVRVLGRFPFVCPPHSPLVGKVVNLEGARLLFRRVLDNLTVVRSLLLGAGVLGRWGFLFLNQFGCVSPSNIFLWAGWTKMDLR